MVWRLGVGQQSQRRELGSSGLASADGAAGCGRCCLRRKRPKAQVISRCRQQVCRLLLRRRRLPEQPCHRVRVRSLSNFRVLERVFGASRRVYFLRGRDDVGVQDLDLFGPISIQFIRNPVNSTYKVVAVFEVASQSNLASTVALWPPLAPIESVDGPGCKIVAGAGLCIRELAAQASGRV